MSELNLGGNYEKFPEEGDDAKEHAGYGVGEVPSVDGRVYQHGEFVVPPENDGFNDTLGPFEAHGVRPERKFLPKPDGVAWDYTQGDPDVEMIPGYRHWAQPEESSKSFIKASVDASKSFSSKDNQDQHYYQDFDSEDVPKQDVDSEVIPEHQKIDADSEAPAPENADGKESAPKDADSEAPAPENADSKAPTPKNADRTKSVQENVLDNETPLKRDEQELTGQQKEMLEAHRKARTEAFYRRMQIPWKPGSSDHRTKEEIAAEALSAEARVNKETELQGKNFNRQSWDVPVPNGASEDARLDPDSYKNPEIFTEQPGGREYSTLAEINASIAENRGELRKELLNYLNPKYGSGDYFGYGKPDGTAITDALNKIYGTSVEDRYVKQKAFMKAFGGSNAQDAPRRSSSEFLTSLTGHNSRFTEFKSSHYYSSN